MTPIFTTLEDEVFLAPGVNVTVLPHMTIGEGALIGTGSVVMHNIPPFTVAYGHPARPVNSVGESLVRSTW